MNETLALLVSELIRVVKAGRSPEASRTAYEADNEARLREYQADQELQKAEVCLKLEESFERAKERQTARGVKKTTRAIQVTGLGRELQKEISSIDALQRQYLAIWSHALRKKAALEEAGVNVERFLERLEMLESWSMNTVAKRYDEQVEQFLRSLDEPPEEGSS